MFSLTESNKFVFYGSSVDLRKGVDRLCGLVRMHSLVPTDGSVYVFMNRPRTRMKLLHWERGGYVIYYKRMELGRINHTVFHPSVSTAFYELRLDEMVLLVEGVRGSSNRRKRFNIQ